MNNCKIEFLSTGAGAAGVEDVVEAPTKSPKRSELLVFAPGAVFCREGGVGVGAGSSQFRRSCTLGAGAAATGVATGGNDLVAGLGGLESWRGRVVVAGAGAGLWDCVWE